MSPTAPRIYVLDTSVLIHDPNSIGKFDEHEVIITMPVLEELDKIKTESTERGASAREAIRRITAVMKEAKGDTPNVAPLPLGGQLVLLARVEAKQKGRSRVQRESTLAPTSNDNRIILIALELKAAGQKHVVLVSNDLSMQAKARAARLLVEPYKHDEVDESPLLRGPSALQLSDKEMQAFASRKGRGPVALTIDDERTDGLVLNEYLVLKGPSQATMLARYRGDRGLGHLLTINELAVPGGRAIRALNQGQKFYMDALLDPEIDLITVTGGPGTGKSLLPVAYALTSFNPRSPLPQHFRRMVLTRPIIEDSQSLGFLPGTKEEKLMPWFGPTLDALNLLLPNPNGPEGQQGPARKNRQKGEAPEKKGPPKNILAKLIEEGRLEAEGLTFIKGRSIEGVLIVCEEATDGTPKDMKKLVTRGGKGSKTILSGDPGQVENPFLTARTNGLVVTATKMRGDVGHVHIHLTEGERSRLATAASERL